MSKLETREVVLEGLYEADSLEYESVEVGGMTRRACELATAIWSGREALDEAITEASTSWRIGRMPVVDRNILRIAVYELLETDLPVGVVISEAVELAKKYSTSSSGAFVNGVLSSVAGSHRES